MRMIRYIQASWIMLVSVVLLGLLVSPVGATSRTMGHPARPGTMATARVATSTSISATFYLTTATLEPMFANNIASQVPASFNSAIAAIISKLPKQDQGWAQQMATTLIQPSGELTYFAPTQGGLVGSLRLSLYPGDPKAINASMLFSFSVLDSSTAQVTVEPLNGSPALESGPISTFSIPVGQLNSINATPNCGDAALALHLQFPVSLGQSALQSQQTALNTQASSNASSVALYTKTQAPANVSSYVEIPASSLASVGSSIGSMPVGNSITAQNIQLTVQGSNILISSDIYWNGLELGTAVTTLAPTASNGNLAVRVLNTTLSLFGIFSFPYNSYNQQIQQTLNSKLGSAFAGKFYVTQAAIGYNSHVPCAASNSLILTGSSSL